MTGQVPGKLRTVRYFNAVACVGAFVKPCTVHSTVGSADPVRSLPAQWNGA